MSERTVTPLTRILAATFIMDILLDGKTDRFGQPLSAHCRHVLAACRRQGLSDDQCIAAVLHEVYEDSPVSRDTIRDLFGRDVDFLVGCLTHTYGKTYAEYIADMRHEPRVIPIKLADLADNLDPRRVDPATGQGIPASLRRRYERARAYLLGAQSALDKAQER